VEKWGNITSSYDYSWLPFCLLYLYVNIIFGVDVALSNVYFQADYDPLLSTFFSHGFT